MPDSDGDMLRWGIIGASSTASEYILPAIRAVDGCEAVGVFSTDAERGRAYAEAEALEKSYGSLAELLSDESLDAVFVGTTNDLHRDQTIAAAVVGKHVLCEKPMATSVEDAVAMRAACAQAGVVLGINHHLRCQPVIQEMHRRVDDGAIGEVVATRVFFAGYLPEYRQTWRISRPETGAGVVLDLTVHDIDTVRYLLDDDIAEVVALTAQQGMAKGSIEDAAMTVYRMRGGSLLLTHDAFTVPYAGTGVEVHGREGSLIAREVLQPHPAGELFLRRGSTTEQVEIAEWWDPYERVVSRFAAAVAGDGEPAATGDDGIASLAAAVAALESASTGRRVVVSAG